MSETNGTAQTTETTNRLPKVKTKTTDWLGELDELARRADGRGSVSLRREHETAGKVRARIDGFPDSFAADELAAHARAGGVRYTRPVPTADGVSGTATKALSGAAAESFVKRFLKG